MAGQPIAGTDGRVSIQGVNLNVEKFTVTPSATDIDGFNFESQGYDEGITGKKSCDIEFEGFLDATQSPFANPPDLIPGQIIGPGLFYTSKSLNKVCSFPLMRILSTPITNEANGRVNYSVSAKSQGPFTLQT